MQSSNYFFSGHFLPWLPLLQYHRVSQVFAVTTSPLPTTTNHVPSSVHCRIFIFSCSTATRLESASHGAWFASLMPKVMSVPDSMMTR